MANPIIITLNGWLATTDDWTLTRMILLAIELEYLCDDLDDDEGWATFETSKETIRSAQSSIAFLTAWSVPTHDQRSQLIASFEKTVERMRGKSEAL